MISAKEANIISLVNDCFGDYLDSIEKDIIKAAKAGECHISIELISFGLDITADNGNKITNTIVNYLRSFGYNVFIDDSDYYASLLIDWSVIEDQNN